MFTFNICTCILNNLCSIFQVEIRDNTAFECATVCVWHHCSILNINTVYSGNVVTTYSSGDFNGVVVNAVAIHCSISSNITNVETTFMENKGSGGIVSMTGHGFLINNASTFRYCNPLENISKTILQQIKGFLWINPAIGTPNLRMINVMFFPSDHSTEIGKVLDVHTGSHCNSWCEDYILYTHRNLCMRRTLAPGSLQN